MKMSVFNVLGCSGALVLYNQLGQTLQIPLSKETGNASLNKSSTQNREKLVTSLFSFCVVMERAKATC